MDELVADLFVMYYADWKRSHTEIVARALRLYYAIRSGVRGLMRIVII